MVYFFRRKQATGLNILLKSEGSNKQKDMLTNNKPKYNFFSDISLWFLLISNVITIFFALTQNWNLLNLMWVYWFQSIAIGFINFIRILQLEEFSTEGFTINKQPTQPTNYTKIFTAFFFLFHYGLFHFVYLIFLATGLSAMTNESSTRVVEPKFIILSALFFFVTHLFSYFYNKPRDTKNQNIGSLMSYPYARIIPMHITIFFGFFFHNTILVFLLLKTFADISMHIYEHSILRKAEEPILAATNTNTYQSN